MWEEENDIIEKLRTFECLEIIESMDTKYTKPFRYICCDTDPGVEEYINDGRLAINIRIYGKYPESLLFWLF